MVTQQFHIDFFPLKGIEIEVGYIPTKLPDQYLLHSDNTGLDLDSCNNPSSVFWKNYNRDSLKYLINKLSRELIESEWLHGKSEVFSWSNSDFNDITLSLNEDDLVENFHCRINLRDIDEVFIDYLLDLCRSNNYLLADKKGNLMTPDKKLRSKLINSSYAVNFVLDPEKFMNDFVQKKRHSN